MYIFYTDIKEQPVGGCYSGMHCACKAKALAKRLNKPIEIYVQVDARKEVYYDTVYPRGASNDRPSPTSHREIPGTVQ